MKVLLVASGMPWYSPNDALPNCRRCRRPFPPVAAHSTALSLGQHPKVARISTYCRSVTPGCDSSRSTMSVTQEQIHGVLKEIRDPNTGKDLLATKSVKNLRIDGNAVTLEVELGYPAKTQFDPMRRLVSTRLHAIPRIRAVSVNVPSKIVSHSVQRGVKLIPGVKNIIAVASCKR